GTDTKNVTVADPTRMAGILNLDVIHGSLATLGPRQIAVSKRVADDKGWSRGTTVPLTFPDGATMRARIGAIYKNRDITGNYIIPRATWTPHAIQDLDTTVPIKLARGVSLEAGRTAVERAVRPYGAPDVQDQREYAASLGTFVDMMLGIVYVL